MAHATDGTIGTNLDEVSTDEQFTLGTRVTGSDGSVWVYVQASGAITTKYWVAIDENFQAALLTDALALTGLNIGVAPAAFADNEYGWVCVSGSNITAALASGCAADIDLYTSTVPGVLDDSTSVTGTRVVGATPVAANTISIAGAFEVIVSNPRAVSF